MSIAKSMASTVTTRMRPNGCAPNVLFIIAVFVAIAAANGRAPLHPEQQFRAGVTVAVLDVIVTDSRGEPVPDLQLGDFEVIDNGTSREVVSARFVATSADAAVTGGPEDVWSNVQHRSSHLFVIVVDDLNLAPYDVGRAREALRRFVSLIPSGALTSIVYRGSQTGIQEFTADKTRLLKTMEGLGGRRPDSEEESAPMEERHNARRALDTLRSVTTWLSGDDERRKAVIFLNSGFDAAISAEALVSGAIADDLRELIGSAMRAHVALYPVDVRGLEAPPAADRSVEALRALAAATGGILTVNTNDMDSGVRAAVRDLAGYYLVGYNPPENRTARPSALHRVQVRVRRAGMNARWRRLYANLESDAIRRPPELSALLRAPVPTGTLGFEMHAAVTGDGTGGARLWTIIEVLGDRVGFMGEGADKVASLRYEIVATDVRGHVAGRDSQIVKLHLAPERQAQVHASRTRLVSTFVVKPGSYRVRAALIDDTTREYGSVSGDMDVTPYKRGTLAMSSVFVVAGTASHMPTVRRNVAAFMTHLSSVPTTLRTFSRNEAVDVYAEVYGANDGESLVVTASVKEAAGHVVSSQSLVAAPGGRGLGGTPCQVLLHRLTIDQFSAGLYTLEILARSGSSTTSKQVPFTLK
jgi:VWFA-related protein